MDDERDDKENVDPNTQALGNTAAAPANDLVARSATCARSAMCARSAHTGPRLARVGCDGRGCKTAKR